MMALVGFLLLAQTTGPTLVACQFHVDEQNHPHAVDIDCGAALGLGHAVMAENGNYYSGRMGQKLAGERLFILPESTGGPPGPSYVCWDQGLQVLCGDPDDLRDAYEQFNP